ncbi:MAG: crossover junction endodeoxyribonuclease RuvC [Phycisphaerales bacterium]
MKIIGIDPGLRLTGYGCIDTTAGTCTILEAGVFRLESKAPIVQRLGALYHDLCATLDELQPEVIAVERLFAAYRHPRTAIIMGHARGVVLLAAQLRNLQLIELSATEVKRSITGNGHASKDQMQQAIMARFNLAQPPHPPDVADALGIAACAAGRVQTLHVQ